MCAPNHGSSMIETSAPRLCRTFPGSFQHVRPPKLLGRAGCKGPPVPALGHTNRKVEVSHETMQIVSKILRLSNGSLSKANWEGPVLGSAFRVNFVRRS